MHIHENAASKVIFVTAQTHLSIAKFWCGNIKLTFKRRANKVYLIFSR